MNKIDIGVVQNWIVIALTIISTVVTIISTFKPVASNIVIYGDHNVYISLTVNNNPDCSND